MPLPLSLPNLSEYEISAIRKRLSDMLGEEETRMGGLRTQAAGVQSEYEKLAGAPAPEVGAVEGGIQQLFGDMGSIISRRPEFGERSREDIKQRGAMLREQRMQNIQILRDKYQDIAAAAEKLDPIKALKYSELVSRQNKLLEQMHEDETLGFQAKTAMERTQATIKGGQDEARIRGTTDVEVAKIRAAADKYSTDAQTFAGLGKLPEDKYDERRLKILSDFKALKGGIPSKTTPLAAASILGITKATDDAVTWQARAQTDIKTLLGKKSTDKLPPEYISQIQFWRRTHFPPVLADSVDVNAPAVEVPGTPPDNVLERIDNALDGLDYSQALRKLREMRLKNELPTTIDIRMILDQKFAPPSGPRLNAPTTVPSGR